MPEEIQLKPKSKLGSGRVRRFVLPGRKIRISQITTFCPDIIGPGPTHLYLIEADALILVDAGMPTYLVKEFFYHWRDQPMPKEIDCLPQNHNEQEFLEAMSLLGRDVSEIDLLVITHGHADHYLSVRSITDKSNSSISAHILDTQEMCNPWGILTSWLLHEQQMVGTGMPPPHSVKKSVRDQLYRGLDLDSMGLSFKVDSPIFEEGPLRVKGSEIPGIEVKHLPGHTPGSIGLIVGNGSGEGVLIGGDILLSPITPHPNDLLMYLRTLEVLNSCDYIKLVLPAHGQVIRDLKSRVEFIKKHHYKRLKVTYEACEEPKSVWDIATMRRYFDTYVDPKRFNFLAGLEALVHMEMLTMVGGLQRVEIKDGVHYFKNSGELFDNVYARIMDFVNNIKISSIMRY